jgi:deazaflavin-dependent oxidoreductase (nitroreductase family)
MNPYQRLVDYLAATRLGATWFKRLATVIDRRLIRWSGGRLTSGIGTSYRDRIVLVTTTGWKSGEPRTVPLLHTRVGDRIVLVASNGGDEEHPAWFRNLSHEPRCLVRLGREEVPFVATIAEGAERAALLEAAIASYAGYATYVARVNRREIPVVVLDRAP